MSNDLRRSQRYVLLGLLCILTSYGCQSTPPEPPAEVAGAEDLQAASAAQLIDRALRTMDPAEAAALFTTAARLQYDAGDVQAAASTLARVEAHRLGLEGRFDVHFLRAAFALGAGDVAAAHAELDLAIPSSTEQQQDHLRLRAQAFSAQGDHERAANRLMDLSALVAGRDRRPSGATESGLQAVHDDIWAAVNRAPLQRVPRLAAASRSPVQRGWWSLAAAMQDGFDLDAQRRALADWQQRNREHPAARVPPAPLRLVAERLSSPRHVALLLPLSGPLAHAGHAVRDGFLAGFFYSGSAMSISVHDTHNASIAGLYEEAFHEGAELIVGPLDRPSLAAISALDLHIPVLGLNYLAPDQNGNAGLLQFSLAIEHESAAIARQLMTEGIERVLVFHAGNDWSQRARLEFRSRFSEFGGTIVDEDFFASPSDITPTVGSALLIPRSAERHAALARLIGATPEFMPRRRGDVEAIVALIDADQARALKPALAYHFAGEIPVYTTSQAIQNLSPSAWRELDGIRIAQIPWRLSPTAVKAQVNDHFPDSRGDMQDLYAFGVDAYRIADRIQGFFDDPNARLVGGTGILRLGDDGRIGRELVWTRMRGGSLEPLLNGGR